MKTLLAAGLVVAWAALAVAPALAADQGPSPSVDKTPIADLAARPDLKAILDRDVPGLTAHPAFEQFKGMTLKDLQPMSQGQLTDAQIAAVQADLDKLPK